MSALAPIVRPYRRWRRRAVVFAIVAALAGGYRYYEWVNDVHFTTQAELTQRRLDRIAIAAVEWLRLHAPCPTLKKLLVETEDLVDVWGNEIDLTCTSHDAVIVQSAGQDGRFRTRDDQISARIPLTPLEPP